MTPATSVTYPVGRAGKRAPDRRRPARASTAGGRVEAPSARAIALARVPLNSSPGAGRVARRPRRAESPASGPATSPSACRSPVRIRSRRPVTGVGLIALPYDRDSVLAALETSGPLAAPGHRRPRQPLPRLPRAVRQLCCRRPADREPPRLAGAASPRARLAAAQHARVPRAVRGVLSARRLAQPRPERRAERARQGARPGPRRVRRAQRKPARPHPALGR